MRALVQRVRKGAVRVGDEIVGEIGTGFVVLLGVTHADTEGEARWLAGKVAGLRVFEDRAGKMNAALHDVNGSVLVISQFTLYGDARKGRRPSFTNAAAPERAEPLVDQFVAQLREYDLEVSTGVFGAHMIVEIENDGPVTLLLEREAPE